MKVLNEAIVGEYHFVISDEYLNITLDRQEVVHLSYAEAQEVVPWLMTKLGHYKGSEAIIEPFKTSTVTPTLPMCGQNTEVKPKWNDADPFVGRSARQSVPMKVGDPFLAESAPLRSKDGKQTIAGVQINDLAADLLKAGIPILRK